jgi:spermidine synthase
MLPRLRLPTRLLILGLVACATLARAEPTVLYERESPFGPVIVTEERGLRTLWFEKGGARQTVVKLGDPAHLDLPYAGSAFTGLALCAGPRRVLVVGLGGGTLPMFLRHYYPDATIDAVDINPDVVKVAREFFGFRDDARMRAHVADGRKFIEETSQPYDLIFLDAFGADSVPPSLTTREFLGAVRRALRPDGVVVGNIWNRAHNPLHDSMVRTYQEVFSELYILDVQHAGNRIVLALPRRQPLTREQFAELATKVSRTKGFRFDLGERVIHGFNHATARSSEGRVLHDADFAAKK